MTCQELEEGLALYLYDEFTPEERAACEAHLAECANCRALVEKSQSLRQLLSQRGAPEPTPELLVRCRQALDEALDREQFGWRGLFRKWLPAGAAFPASRAVATLTVLVLGFTLGWTLRPHAGKILPTQKVTTSSTPAGGTGVSAADLTNLRINDITQVAPDPQTGEVHITLNAERRMTLEGSLDDPRIRQLLVDAVKGYGNAGIRRDTLDALRAQSNRPSIREAVLYAMVHDPNAGMRLEALKTAQGMECGADVHKALIEVVEREKNPGVRLSAIDTLVDHALREKDKSLAPTLERLANGDPDRYVRIRCANAVHDLVRNAN